MKYIVILKLSVVALCSSLASCYSPASANPVGDTFTHAGDAIGKAVNSVVPQAPAPASAQPQYDAPYPAPVSGYPAQ